MCSVWVARRPPGYAFIDFDDYRDAQDAIRELDGMSRSFISDYDYFNVINSSSLSFSNSFDCLMTCSFTSFLFIYFYFSVGWDDGWHVVGNMSSC